MNPEIEKLLNFAFTDGHISPKEREVLTKKAQDLGMTEGEIDIIIDALIYKNSNNAAKAENKCPECGDGLDDEGFCANCQPPAKQKDISINTEYYLEGLRDSLNHGMRHTKDELRGSGWQIFKWFKIIFTGGLYIPYKILLRKEYVFDGRRIDNQIREARTALYFAMVQYTTGGRGRVSETAKLEYGQWKKEVRNQRIKDTFVSLLFFIVIGLPAYGIYKAVVRVQKIKAAEQTAQANSPEMQEKDKKQAVLYTADSIVNAGGPDMANNVVDALKPLDNKDTNKYLISKIARLSEENKFDEAKLLLDKVKSYNRSDAEKQIQMAEALAKFNIQK